MKKTILFTLLSILIFSCSQPEKMVQIDNSSEESIIVNFGDDQTITIEPNQVKTTTIKFGETKIINNEKEEREQKSLTLFYLAD